MTNNPEMINGHDAIKMVLGYELDTLAEAEAFEYVYMATNDNKPLVDILATIETGFDMLVDVIEDAEELDGYRKKKDVVVAKMKKAIALLENAR